MSTRCQKGQIVMIYNQTIAGKTIEEGEAKLIRFKSKDQFGIETWDVCFLSDQDRETYQRRIYIRENIPNLPDES